MPPFRLSYSVTAEVKAALARFPKIANAVPLPDAGSSALHLVRLLDNTHHPNVERLLDFIERELPGSGDIGTKALKQLDPFQSRELVAELFLFAHLRARLASGVRPADGPKARRRPEIECVWRSLNVRIEVYSPTDLMAFELKVKKFFSASLALGDPPNPQESCSGLRTGAQDRGQCAVNR